MVIGEDVTSPLRALDNSTIPSGSHVEIEAFPSGSNNSGSPRKDSGAKLRVTAPFIGENGTMTESTANSLGFTTGVSGRIEIDAQVAEGEVTTSRGVTGNRTDTKRTIDLPTGQQYTVPINIVPTGRVDNGDIIRVQTPAAVRAELEPTQ